MPCYVLTGGTQGYKAFTDLPKDLPCAYGSLTVSHKSFRPWLGPKNTSAFHVPGMEFFATTGVYKNGYDYHNELDSIDGRITLSYKGVHFAPTLYYSSGNGEVDSLPFTFFDTHYKFTGRWFRQITPLGIRYALSLGTNVFPKAPRLVHALGALGLSPQAAPQHFQRAAEVALCASLNVQSQAPDIPGVSSRAAFLRHTSSLQTISKDPDICSLRSYTEELLASLNAQAQAPDDPSQILVSDFYLLSLRVYMEKLSASFNAQDQVPDDLHDQDHQCAPCIFVQIFQKCRQELARFPPKKDVSHLSLQQVSQVSAQELVHPSMTLPYQGVSRIEFHMCCLWILVVSQGVDCVYSVGLGCSWTFTVIIFDDQRGSTLFVSVYISFA